MTRRQRLVFLYAIALVVLILFYTLLYTQIEDGDRVIVAGTDARIREFERELA